MTTEDEAAKLGEEIDVWYTRAMTWIQRPNTSPDSEEGKLASRCAEIWETGRRDYEDQNYDTAPAIHAEMAAAFQEVKEFVNPFRRNVEAYEKKLARE